MLVVIRVTLRHHVRRLERKVYDFGERERELIVAGLLSGEMIGVRDESIKWIRW